MQLTPLERVKVHLALAQSVVVLYQLHRKLAAAKMDNHPLQKELVRSNREVWSSTTADCSVPPGSSSAWYSVTGHADAY